MPDAGTRSRWSIPRQSARLLVDWVTPPRGRRAPRRSAAWTSSASDSHAHSHSPQARGATPATPPRSLPEHRVPARRPVEEMPVDHGEERRGRISPFSVANSSSVSAPRSCRSASCCSSVRSAGPSGRRRSCPSRPCAAPSSTLRRPAMSSLTRWRRWSSRCCAPAAGVDPPSGNSLRTWRRSASVPTMSRIAMAAMLTGCRNVRRRPPRDEQGEDRKDDRVDQDGPAPQVSGGQPAKGVGGACRPGQRGDEHDQDAVEDQEARGLGQQ